MGEKNEFENLSSLLVTNPTILAVSIAYTACRTSPRQLRISFSVHPNPPRPSRSGASESGTMFQVCLSCHVTVESCFSPRLMGTRALESPLNKRGESFRQTSFKEYEDSVRLESTPGSRNVVQMVLITSGEHSRSYRNEENFHRFGRRIG